MCSGREKGRGRRCKKEKGEKEREIEKMEEDQTRAGGQEVLAPGVTPTQPQTHC